MSANGRMADSELSPIPGGRLRTDAAVAWNAMHSAALHDGLDLRPRGPASSYRTLAQQEYFWDQYKNHGGNLAAEPGTSNHGWGLAVDVATQEMRGWIDNHGAPFGWQKQWSDAPSEWWHIRFRTGIWHPPADTRLREGSRGPSIWLLTHRLAVCGWISHSGFFYSHHVALVVAAFQRHHHLPVNGITDDKTWLTAKSAAARCRQIHRKETPRPL